MNNDCHDAANETHEHQRHCEGAFPGWSLDEFNTARVIRELPLLLGRAGVKSLLDAPCGDFGWMRRVDLTGIDYVGVDRSAAVVEENQRKWSSAGRRFDVLDILEGELPHTDLVLCRDLLSCLSHVDVFRALERFGASGARWLLTTTYTYRSYPRNGDIRTGQWTPVNLELPPYSLGVPSALIIEGSSEFIDFGGETGIVSMADRCLGLWDMSMVRRRLDGTVAPDSINWSGLSMGRHIREGQV